MVRPFRGLCGGESDRGEKGPHSCCPFLWFVSFGQAKEMNMYQGQIPRQYLVLASWGGLRYYNSRHMLCRLSFLPPYKSAENSLILGEQKAIARQSTCRRDVRLHVYYLLIFFWKLLLKYVYLYFINYLIFLS